MQIHEIKRGASVEFETPAGPQQGTVHALFADVFRGCQVAQIEVPGTIDGAPWFMPVIALQLSSASTNA
ncbi:hypothetical protein [Pseudoduganella violaceinigra]|uniref:hypothetical protein n=1 Tax=Pseudoduganella violaceinigra TaxID=246602 RepID=UPI0012B56F21|nr:hypothetical protein [Pseudoduganella violaceinigra]